jgi:hypothetical protein
MKKLILIILIAVAAWQGYAKYQSRQQVLAAEYEDSQATDPSVPKQGLSTATSQQSFKCDGRIHCSQMTSCAEATYFLRNCPGTKMDGDGDGIPCEQQWCGG